MKCKHLKHLFTVLLLLCATMATAHDFEVDGIYYKILSETDKTVEVTFKGTSYSEYSNEYSGSVVIPQTVTMSETGTNVLKTFDTWTSNNKSNSTTSQTSYTLNVEAGNILKFDWSVSSESNYDWLIITLDGTEIVKKSGTLSGSYEKTFDTSGSHTLVVKYTKDSSQSSGNDEGKIYNITLSSVGSVNDVVYRVTSIGELAFYKCSGLANVVIPNSVTSIGSNVFRDCSSLTSIEIPNSVTSIANRAFNGCTSLKDLRFEDGEGTLSLGYNSDNSYGDGKGLFYDCPLETLYLGRNLSYDTGYEYGMSPFRNKTTLTSVVIGNCVTSIGDWAFNVCRGLTSIEIPNNVTIIGNGAFSVCTGLTNIEIPNSVTSIGFKAFEDCIRLTSITIPNSVTSIGYDAFSNCSGLNEVHINDLAAWCNIDFGGGNPLYNAKKLYLNGELVTELVIPDGVTEIKNYAFEGCSFLTSVEIPNSVTSIGNEAFEGCSGLTSIEIPNSVTSIGDLAFTCCSSLGSVVIGNSVTSIGSTAFSECTGLTSVTSLIPADELFAIDSYVFYNVDKTTCTLYVPVGAKSTYASTTSWSEFTNIVELEPASLHGDINGDGEVNVGDFAALVNLIFNSGSQAASKE